MYQSFKASLLKKHATPEERQQLLDARTRAIDQVSWIYAVIMGYAATQLMANQYAVVQTDGFAWLADGGYVVSQAVCFASLITLFYLGAQRMLAARYLRPISGDATRSGLFIDILVLAVQGLLFMILANTTPTPAEFAKLGHAIAQQANQMRFVTVLIWLYAIDTVTLFVQWYRFSKDPTYTGDIEAIKAHVLWFVLNLATLVVLCVASQWPGDAFTMGRLTVTCLSATVFVTHVARFWADYANTFQFYYPHLER